MSSSQEVLFPTLQLQWGSLLQHVLSAPPVNVPIRKRPLGDRSGVFAPAPTTQSGTTAEPWVSAAPQPLSALSP